MRDGIFSYYVRSEETAVRAIALVENDSIKAFNRSNIYSLERLEIFHQPVAEGSKLPLAC